MNSIWQNFFSLIIFILGLIVGSFLNCLIYRMEIGTSALKGRSFCPHCRHTLSTGDLIPVFSFLFLKGKCRYCYKKISFQYPLVEISTGLIFFLIFIFHYKILIPNAVLSFSSIINLLFLLVISCLLIIIFVFDLKHYIIPDKIVFSGIATAFLYQIFNIWHSDLRQLINPLLSGLVAAAFFGALVLISRGKWMGLGDVKLAFFMGLFLSYPDILVALSMAFFIGAIVGLILMALKKKKMSSEIPFGPFLVLGTFIALFFSQRILDCYFSLFLLK